MITALNIKKLFSLVAFLLAVAALFVWLFSDANLVTKSFQTVSWAVVFATILGHHIVIDWLWRHCPCLNLLIAPNLNGQFILESSSNWAIKQQMLNALNKTPGGENENTPNTSQFTVTGTLSIKMGLLKIRMAYLPSEDGISRSKTEVVCAHIHINPDSDFYEFSYVYKGSVLNPNVATDEQTYSGAALLKIKKMPVTPTTMEGHYWTNRSWQRGLNTAGIAKLARVNQPITSYKQTN